MGWREALFPVRTTGRDLKKINCLITCGNGAANGTVTYGPGVSAFTYNGATGKFYFTFTDTYLGTLVGFSVIHSQATGVDPILVTPTVGGYSDSAGTLLVEANDLAGTLTNFSTGQLLYCEFAFSQVT